MRYYVVVYRHKLESTLFECRLHAESRLDAFNKVIKHGDPVMIRRLS